MNNILKRLRGYFDDQPTSEECAAEIERILTKLADIASIAHDGGLRELDEGDALSFIRQATLPYWERSGTQEIAAARVYDAMLRITKSESVGQP